MLVEYLKAKLHRAVVTEANLEYEGSISIDKVLLEASGIRPFEKVHIYNITNGERFETYAIEGDTGTICLNGAAAWKAHVHDRIIIVSYCTLNESEAANHKPKLVFLDSDNKIKSITNQVVHGTKVPR